MQLSPPPPPPPPALAPPPPLAGFPPGYPSAPPARAGPNKKVVAGAVVLVLVVGALGAAALMGAFAGPGQCVLQEVDFQGNVHYTRGENYSPAECDAYCEARLPPNGGARDCWFDEY